MSFARRSANLIAAVAQAIVPALGYLGVFGKTVGSDIQSIKTPVVPADYAFIIWPFIFVASLIYAVDQANPEKASDPLYRRIGWLTAAAFAANALWSVTAQLEISLSLTGVIFLVTFVAMLRAMIATARTPHAPRTTRIAVGVLAGWVTVAIFANWSVILSEAGIAAVLGESALALVFLFGAAITAAIVIWRTKADAAYALTIVWALLGLVAGNVQRGETLIATAAGGLLVLLSATMVAAARRPAAV